MTNVQFAALGGAAVLMLAGWCHAAGVPVGQGAVLPDPAAGSAMLLLHHAADASALADGASVVAGTGPAAAAAARPPGLAPAPGHPLHAYLRGAGQYVLDVGSFAGGRRTAGAVSAVPLPGALWLFGSALLVFLGISGRRRF